MVVVGFLEERADGRQGIQLAGTYKSVSQDSAALQKEEIRRAKMK